MGILDLLMGDLLIRGMLPEVLPSERAQLRPKLVGMYQQNVFVSRYHTNFSDRDSPDHGWNCSSLGSGEQQLIIFAAVQREAQIDRASGTADFGLGNQVFPDLGAGAALLTNVGEIDRKSVANVDHG